ncbi:MAG: YbhB/YbcL family Raf kinase inhibitor-like protein [Acidimicrobiales bacterium]
MRRAADPVRRAGSGGGFALTSPAFTDGGAIPREHSCQGEGVSPELAWSGAPAGTQSLALIVHDPDAPIAGGFTHWVLYAIPGDTTGIPQGGTAGSSGLNSTGKPGWVPPCPPSGTHRYVFTLYALPTVTAFATTPTKDQVEALGADALATATLTGTYAKS